MEPDIHALFIVDLCRALGNISDFGHHVVLGMDTNDDARDGAGTAFCLSPLVVAFGACANNEANFNDVITGTFIKPEGSDPVAVSLIQALEHTSSIYDKGLPSLLNLILKHGGLRKIRMWLNLAHYQPVTIYAQPLTQL